MYVLIYKKLHGFNSCGQGADDDAIGFAKVPDVPCVSQMLGGPSLRLGIPIERQNGLAFLQELDEVGMTQVDWQRGIVHCVLIQNLEYLSNHSYNLFHFAIPVFGQ